MPYRHGRRRKKRTHNEAESEQDKNAPKSFVFKLGRVASPVQKLIHDVRCVMEPYTAVRLSESTKNKLKDFVGVAGPLGVTHFMVFSQTDFGVNLRIMRFPRGPSLVFRVDEYSLIRDIAATQRKPQALNGPEYHSPPLVVLNGFSNQSGSEVYKEIMSTTLQNMFPAIDVSSIKLNSCRRVVLFNLQTTKDGDAVVSVRHYLITAKPTGISRPIRKIVTGSIPSRLGHAEDISDFVLEEDGMNGYLSSDSEAEDLPEYKVELAQDFKGRGNIKSHKSALRLKELGPRLELKLIKIETGFNEGAVLYHRYVNKTKDEKKALESEIAEKKRLKEERRRKQEENVEKKAQKTVSFSEE